MFFFFFYSVILYIVFLSFSNNFQINLFRNNRNFVKPLKETNNMGEDTFLLIYTIKILEKILSQYYHSGINGSEGYFTPRRAPELESHCQVQFSVNIRKHHFKEVSSLCRIKSQRIQVQLEWPIFSVFNFFFLWPSRLYLCWIELLEKELFLYAKLHYLK